MGLFYTFPYKQSIGAPAEPVIGTGDLVERGQLIARKPQDKIGANIFSSVTGKVAAMSGESMVIEDLGTDFSKFIPLEQGTPIELIQRSGLAGLGGAGFPTYVKMQSKLSADGTVILNAAECEPILNHNIARIEQEPGRLLDALQLAMTILSVRRGVIAIKSVHEKALHMLWTELRKRMLQEAEARNTGAGNAVNSPVIKIHELPDMYPMGEERAVIREVMGILLPPDALPAEADAVVLNAETAYRMEEAVSMRKPLIDKDMTVAGKLYDNASSHVLMDVPIGRAVSEVFKMAGGIGKSYGEVIMGGPFTGKSVSLDSPVLKTTGGLIAAECFLKGPERLGLLVCACGADKKRLEEIASKMGSRVTDVQYCKQAHARGNALKCENPGHCPGQAAKVMALKKAGAQAVLISNCTDCTNTVMSCAPKLGLPVYHCTDGALRSVNHRLIRRIKG
ncbi:MAG TPA: proline reductase-associated electron transfer protein PrdC [Lachnospiraceae bacterium]|nr:proline reductase-associated electron transfer protein PrdC [Lachnospiraceae bacterium]